MAFLRTFRGCRILLLALTGGLAACECNPTAAEQDDEESRGTQVDPALNGAWVDGVQSGPVAVYITELRFNNGKFEWTWDQDLQQRGIYDTQNGVLTVTIQNSYGYPPRLLGDLSRPYTVTGHALNWGGAQFTKK